MWRVWNAATGQWKSATDKQDFPPLPWLVDGKPVAVIKDGVDQSWLTQATTRAGLDFIRQQAAKPSSSRQPFFCYLPYAAVHLPRFGHPDFLPDDYSGEGGKDIADYDIGIHLKAQIEELDWAVGQVLNTLNELGIEKNTLVLFLSDNGGSRGTDMGPLRGSKYSSVYEGGQRTAFLAWWPGTIPAGRTSDEIGISSDLLPTLAGLCGGFLSDRPIDGKDIANLFIESENAQSPHDFVPNKGRGYRQGKWKIVGGRELFDLESDPGETENLAKQYPEKQKELIAENKAWVSSMQNEARPQAKMPDPSPIVTDNEADDLPKLLDWLGEGKDAR
jgi:arylsulfatase A-like enzyme